MSILYFATSFLFSFVFTLVTIRLAKKFNFVDDPKKRKHPAALNKKIIPRAGGLPIYLAFFLASLLFVSFSKNLFGVLIGGLVLVVVGLLDDKFELKNSYKFLAQLAAAIIVVASGIGISYITNPFQILGLNNTGAVIRLDELRIVFNFFGTHSILILADLFAVFWIVWVINMVNFSAGVDGQLGGISLIVLLVIFAESLRFYPSDPGQTIVTTLSVIGAGATLGFLIFNIHPAKIFPGDSGSYFLGFLIAVLSIFSVAKVGTAVLVMAIPLIDGVFTVLRRLFEKKSPFLGDRKHLHHRLLEIGLSQSQVSLFYWLLCAILGAIALTLPSEGKVFAGVVVGIIILGGLLWLNMNLQKEARK